MINVNEIRSGNLLECDGVIAPVYGIGKAIIFVQVEPLTSTDNGSRAWKPSDSNGISLTEDWLLKLGFEYIPEFLGYIIKGMTLIEHEEGWVDFVEPTNFKSIRCVHQLQNLYFALTGTELQLNGLEK